MKIASQERGSIRWVITILCTSSFLRPKQRKSQMQKPLRIKSGRSSKILPAWQMAKVESKREVFQEAQKEKNTVHFATQMDTCHLNITIFTPKSKWRTLQHCWNFTSQNVQTFGYVYHDTSGANISVQYGRPSCPSWTKSVWSSFSRTVMGKTIWKSSVGTMMWKYRTVNAYSCIENKDHFFRCTWMT